MRFFFYLAAAVVEPRVILKILMATKKQERGRQRRSDENMMPRERVREREECKLEVVEGKKTQKAENEEGRKPQCYLSVRQPKIVLERLSALQHKDVRNLN